MELEIELSKEELEELILDLSRIWKDLGQITIDNIAKEK
jgi:hypothetical protein